MGGLIHSVLSHYRHKVPTSKSVPFQLPPAPFLGHLRSKWNPNNLPTWVPCPCWQYRYSSAQDRDPSLHAKFPSLSPTPASLLLASSSPGCLQPVFLSPCFHSHCMLSPASMLPQERLFPNTARWDPALYTCKAIPAAPGRCSFMSVGMDLKPVFLGQIPPCQLYIGVMLGKFVTKVPQCLDLKTRGRMMPILLGCGEE